MEEKKVESKKLTREEKLIIWQNAKKKRQHSTTYSRSNRSFQDLLRVYDSPKQVLAKKRPMSCGRNLNQSLNSLNDNSNKNELAFIPILREKKGSPKNFQTVFVNEKENEVSSPCLSKNLSAIQDEENEKSTETEKASPHFGVRHDQGESDMFLPEHHQLKKILTEEQQANYSIFSFQNDLVTKRNRRQSEKQTKDNNQADPSHFYTYSLKKPRKNDVDSYGIETIITPVKNSSRKKDLFSNSISSIEELKQHGTDVSKFLYVPNEAIEENCLPITDKCDELKKYLSENAKIKTKKGIQSITEKQISKVLNKDVNNNGNYALLELTDEKASSLGFGTKKILTPLKKSLDNIDSKKKDINFVSEGKTTKDFAYLPFDANLVKIVEKFPNEK